MYSVRIYMGAKVITVNHGSATLKDVCNEALRDWSDSYSQAHYYWVQLLAHIPIQQ